MLRIEEYETEGNNPVLNCGVNGVVPENGADREVVEAYQVCKDLDSTNFLWPY